MEQGATGGPADDNEILRMMKDTSTDDLLVKWCIAAINIGFECFNFTEITPTGSTMSNTRIKGEGCSSDVDIMVLLKDVQLEESQFIYNSDIPCYFKVPLPKNEPLCNFPTDNKKYLSVDVLKRMDSKMFRLLHPIKRAAEELGILSETKVGYEMSKSKKEFNLDFGEGWGKGRTVFECLLQVADAILSKRDTSGNLTRDNGSRIAQKIGRVVEEVKENRRMASSKCSKSSSQQIPEQLVDKGIRVLANDFGIAEDDIEMAEDQTNLSDGTENEMLVDDTEGAMHVDVVPQIALSNFPRAAQDFARTDTPWPPKDVKEEIIQGRFHAVARICPANPETGGDFCLSFAEAEVKLSQAMSQKQLHSLKVLKMLKSYLNSGKKILTTYHLKTAHFWINEMEPTAMWGEESIEANVVRVLEYINTCVQIRFLPHYFVRQANLVYDISDDDATLVITNTNSIISGQATISECMKSQSQKEQSVATRKRILDKQGIVHMAGKICRDFIDCHLDIQTDTREPSRALFKKAMGGFRTIHATFSDTIFPAVPSRDAVPERFEEGFIRRVLSSLDVLLDSLTAVVEDDGITEECAGRTIVNELLDILCFTASAVAREDVNERFPDRGDIAGYDVLVPLLRDWIPRMANDVVYLCGEATREPTSE